MNKQEKLKAVTTAIRERLPYLMKLEEGCKIIEEYNNYEGVIIDKTFNEFGKLSGYYILWKNDFSRDYTLEECKQLKIIGKEPMLNDVIDFLTRRNDYLSFTTEYSAWGRKSYLSIYEDFEWDLTKPYLKDQSEELINWLYDLINKEE